VEFFPVHPFPLPRDAGFAAVFPANGPLKEKSRSPQSAALATAPLSSPQGHRRSAMPMKGELSIPTARFNNPKKAKETMWSRFPSEITKSGFLAVVYFCIIGLLITACFIQLVPNFGELSEVLQQYP
jgi:hypothetical protein